jgi:hypothetical protein
MPEPLESELAGVTLESDALPQEDFPPRDLRRHAEAPGHSYLEEAAAVPTSGEPQVPSEDPLINFEFEASDGEAPQPPALRGSQTAPAATAGGAVGDPLQHICLDRITIYNNCTGVSWDKIIIIYYICDNHIHVVSPSRSFVP